MHTKIFHMLQSFTKSNQLYQAFALFNTVLTLPVYLIYIFNEYLTMGDKLKYEKNLFEFNMWFKKVILREDFVRYWCMVSKGPACINFEETR